MLRRLTAGVLIFASTLSATPLSPGDAPENKAAHHIVMAELDEEASCSATAVGAHTLLTAAHCLMPTDDIVVDGQAAKVTKTLYDHADHVLLILSGITFDTHLAINQNAPDYPYVRMWGNPGNALHIYRTGIFVKLIPADPSDDPETALTESEVTDQTFYVYQLAVFAGDSGSGLIAEDKPEVVGVIFGGDKSAHAACYRLQFLPAELAAIQ